MLRDTCVNCKLTIPLTAVKHWSGPALKDHVCGACFYETVTKRLDQSLYIQCAERLANYVKTMLDQGLKDGEYETLPHLRGATEVILNAH